MKLAAVVATLGGVGRIGRAPGTVASIVALPFAWGLTGAFGQGFLVAASILATAIGVWAGDLYARDKETSDPADCVIDELAGQWIACAFAPRTLSAYALAFLFFRLLDILKPWPIAAVQTVRGGLGIVADDVVAALIAGLVVAALARAGVV